MPSLSNPFRQNAALALRELDEQEQSFTEASERESRRMNFRPRPTYIRTPRFVVWFSWIGVAVAIFVWMCKTNHWWTR